MANSDSEITSAMRSNPDKGIRLLMASYKEPIYWHIRRLVVDHEDAQDATQETFVRAYRSFNQHDAKASLGAWLYRIATNEALRIVERCRQALSIDVAPESVANIAADNFIDYTDSVAIKFQNAILSLPQKQQIVFNLRYYDEMTYDEIAQITGSTSTAAKASYHLAKTKIIEYMNNND